MDGSNWFYSKYLLNEWDAESKYLIYAPFPRPSDAEISSVNELTSDVKMLVENYQKEK